MSLVGRVVRMLAASLAASLPIAAHADTRALVVAGLGGEPEYQEAFERQAAESAERLREVAHPVVLLSGADATRDRLQRELESLADGSGAADAVVVMLIGHGTYDERDYRFNVPGADVTGVQLARWLDAVPAGRQLVIAATSSSGALQALLASKTRSVITATKSGGESNVTVFAQYFTEALAETAADTDKDGYVSSREAFDFAAAAVTDHYERRSQMATEHPTRGGAGAPLVLARLGSVPELVPSTPAVQDRLAVLESEIAALRAEKGSREPDAYYAELQRLLLEMALLRRRLPDEAPP